MARTRRRRVVTTAVLASLLSLPGRFAPSAFAATRTVVDDAGRTVAIPSEIRRVVAAGPPAEVLLYALAPDLLSGWTRAPVEAAKPYLMPSLLDVPVLGRLSARENHAAIEAVRAVHADLIVDVGTIDPAHAANADRVQTATATPCLLLDGRLAETASVLSRLGDWLNRRARAADLISFTEHTLRDLDRRVGALSSATPPKVYLARGADGLETARAGSIHAEFLSRVGATNAAASSGTGGLAAVTLEQIRSWTPDLIVTQNAALGAALSHSKPWREISAAKQGRIVVAPSLPFGWLDGPPGINRLVGLSWVASVLHPSLNPGDLRRSSRYAYGLLYGIEPDDDQLAKLLDALPATGR